MYKLRTRPQAVSICEPAAGDQVRDLQAAPHAKAKSLLDTHQVIPATAQMPPYVDQKPNQASHRHPPRIKANPQGSCHHLIQLLQVHLLPTLPQP